MEDFGRFEVFIFSDWIFVQRIFSFSMSRNTRSNFNATTASRITPNQAISASECPPATASANPPPPNESPSNADSSVQGWFLPLTPKAHFQFQRPIVMKLSEFLILLLLVHLQVPRSPLVKVNVYI